MFNLTIKKYFIKNNSICIHIAKIIFLSWFFALCNQIIIPLPFNFVPVSLQPLPVFLLTLFLGWDAIFAFSLTLIQTVFGMPFFSGFEGGIAKLLGPTGGYIWGWLLGMIFLAIFKNFKIKNIFYIFFILVSANVIMYVLGLFQLSLFVPKDKLLILGLYPFLFGNFLKIVFGSFLFYKYNNKKN